MGRQRRPFRVLTPCGVPFCREAVLITVVSLKRAAIVPSDAVHVAHAKCAPRAHRHPPGMIPARLRSRRYERTHHIPCLEPEVPLLPGTNLLRAFFGATREPDTINVSHLAPPM